METRQCLATLYKNIQTQSVPNIEVFADITWSRVNGTTIPADILVATGNGSKPNLVIVNRVKKEITLLELTCPLPQNIEKASQNKRAKYTQLELALSDKGYSVFLIPLKYAQMATLQKRIEVTLIDHSENITLS